MLLYGIILILIIVIACLIKVIRKVTKFADQQLTELDRYREYFILYDQWFLLKQKNVLISDYLFEHGIKKIVVYGMGAFGLRLCDELNESNVKIVKTVDRSYKTIYFSEGEVYSPEEGLKNIDADAIIVTANVPKDVIKSYMNQDGIQIIYLKEIINNM